jgi:hypothetical protein
MAWDTFTNEFQRKFEAEISAIRLSRKALVAAASISRAANVCVASFNLFIASLSLSPSPDSFAKSMSVNARRIDALSSGVTITSAESITLRVWLAKDVDFCTS